MKAVKYLVIGALLVAFDAPVSAQTDNKATVEAIAKVIKENPAAAADQVKAVYKKNKKNAEVLTGIGRAYFEAKDYENARKYADMANKVNQNYGAAYILQGDIEVMNDNGGAASGWYEQATHFDPKNPIGYKKYAMVNSKVSPSAAAAKLEELRQHCPDYPVDLITAQIYDKAGDLSKAIEYYSRVNTEKMECSDMVSYSLDLFLNGDFEKSFEVASLGERSNPRNAALNRICFFDLTNLKKYQEALEYADRLFNKSDSTKITSSDYLYYGYACLGNKEYDKSIEMFTKSLELNKDNESDKLDAMKNIATAYKDKGDFGKAVQAYEKYLGSLKNITALDYNALADMYSQEAEKLTGEAQKEAYKKADGVYAEMVEKFPSIADFATYQRAHIGFALDPETKTGAAKPHYEKLVEIIKGHATKGDNDDRRLVEAYRYLGYYYLLKNDKKTADEYWNKVLAIDPNNETAKQALGIK